MVPKSPRLCLMGDQTQLPSVSKYDFAVINVGVVMAARVILRFWKSTSPPDFKKWMESMLEIVSYEQMLARIKNEDQNFRRSWDVFFFCS